MFCIKNNLGRDSRGTNASNAKDHNGLCGQRECITGGHTNIPRP